ncbi:MAG: ribosome biogenesis GTPase YlqF [Bacillota bacterium]
MTKGQWFPGKMSKALNQLREDLKAVDLAIELIDARIPFSSRNPKLSNLLENKKHIVLLHKADSAEKEATERWLAYYQNFADKAMPFSVKNTRYLKQLMGYLKEQENSLKPKKIKRPLRMIFVGIPNVGKSTLINLFVHKAVTKTGNQPGITRGRQWIRIMPGMELLDTPGILQPRIEKNTINPLSAVGALPAGKTDQQESATWLINCYLKEGKGHYIEERYRVELSKPEQILEQIGLSQGCLQSAGKVNRERTAALILRDYQNGALGRVTLEKPEDFKNVF